MTNFLDDQGTTLYHNGFQIVPIKPGEKRPTFKKWPETKATPKDIERWAANGYAGGGVGILTEHTPAVDLDIRDESVAEQMSTFVKDLVGDTAERIGQPPKRLLLYGTAEPMRKVSSAKYVDLFGDQHQIEILGKGQQFVAYGIHPGTGKPYQWVSNYEPTDLIQDFLPTLTPEHIQDIFAEFDRIADDLGWEVVKKSSGSATAAMDPAMKGMDADERALWNVQPKLDVTTDEVKGWLRLLKGDFMEDYHNWVTCGMALHHQYDGREVGFQLWDRLSQTAGSYDADACRDRWDSFVPDLTSGKPVTAAWIRRHAEELKGQTKLEEYLERYFYVADGDKVFDIKRPSWASMRRLVEFQHQGKNDTHLWKRGTKLEPDRMVPEPVHLAWMEHEDRKMAEGEDYRPGEERVIEKSPGYYVVNTFQRETFPETDDESHIGRMVDHLTYLIPDAVEREWFLDWMAYNVQEPGKRSMVTPLHVSVPHGTGRGFVVKLMEELLGRDNCTKQKMSTVAGEGSAGQYQDFLHQSLFCAVEEVRDGGTKYQVDDKIRDVLTETRLNINIKYGGNATRHVYTNFFLCSNHRDALALPREDRRIMVISGPDHLPEDDEYFEKLYGWLKSDGVGQFYWLLMRRKIPPRRFQRAMDTEGKRAMIEYNQSDTEQLFHEFMRNPTRPVMDVHQVINALEEMSGSENFETMISEKQVVKLLQHHCLQWEGGQRIQFNNKRIRPWLIGTRKNFTKNQAKRFLTECDRIFA